MRENITELKSEINGPVFPLLTPFTDKHFEVDHKGIHEYVNFLVESGAGIILVTIGTSRFNLLTTKEMMAVNKSVVAAARGRAIIIVAGPPTASFIENQHFVRHAEELKADGIIISYPERYYDDNHILNFYFELAKGSQTGILVHELPMRNGYYGTPVQYSLDLLDRLTDIPEVLGIKEECGNGNYAYQILRRIAEKSGVIGAGSMRCFLRDYHAGAKAFLSGIGSFLPGLEIDFHKAIMEGNIEHAHNIVRDAEDPYFDEAVSMGWHPALKETLSIMGLMNPFERPPLARLNKSFQNRLRSIIQSQGWV